MKRHNGQTRYRLGYDPSPEEEHRGIRPRQECAEPGCLRQAVGKPYCLDHLDRIPYVRAIMQEVERRPARPVRPVGVCARCGEEFARARAGHICCARCAKIVRKISNARKAQT